MNPKLSQALCVWLQWTGHESAEQIAQRLRDSADLPSETDLMQIQDTFRRMTVRGYDLESEVASKRIDRDGARQKLHDEFDWLTPEALTALHKHCVLWFSH